ncbi:MAG: efflux RND transporter periplasmic adaptor subunit [Chloroflexi bacterium]|nr:efflux RND transporter periplasmic adaptor subunit [Chloroflexota bacterium]MCI0644335.1 efflux RND transporter periplasmic adaptor subunit [Chloroflexota bacterium]MCI0725138.1 efflux RND transporter periplasmic adaptor subunit [Chloroflexota bacterium]
MSEENRKRRKRWLAISGGLLAVVLCLGVAWLVVRSRAAAAAPGAQSAAGEIVTAFIGDLSASATASGRVVARREAQLALAAGGTVAEIYVAAGDEVKAGDPLLRLDTAALERAVASAEQGLAIQEANLADLLTPASAADVAAAGAAVAQAQANLQDILAGPSQDEIASAEAGVRAAQADIAAAAARLDSASGEASEEEIRAAQIALDQAQAAATLAAEQHSTILVTEPNNFLTEERLAEMELAARAAAVQANADLAAAQETMDLLLNGDASDVAVAQAGLALAAAQRDAAQAQLDLLLLGPSASQIAAAEADLAQAGAELANLQRGPSPAEITMAEVQVENARIQLQRAQNELAAATLAAPFDGRVTAVQVAVGEQAGDVLVEMVDSGSLEVVLEVDEVDIGDIRLGQPAVVTLEAWPDVAIASEVTLIAPRASQSPDSALVTYQVYLSLAQTDRPVRVGMTANASLETARREGILLVPNAAIQADRDNGTYSVTLVERDAQGNPAYRSAPVTIGLRDDDFTQITGGLQAGDELLIGAPQAQPVLGPGQGGGPGGNGPGGGGGGLFGGGD